MAKTSTKRGFKGSISTFLKSMKNHFNNVGEAIVSILEVIRE